MKLFPVMCMHLNYGVVAAGNHCISDSLRSSQWQLLHSHRKQQFIGKLSKTDKHEMKYELIFFTQLPNKLVFAISPTDGVIILCKHQFVGLLS